MIGQKRFEEINKLLNRKLEEKRVLIAVHRGSWHGDIIENTNTAYRNALAMGGDMFECDLSISTDGKLYCFHDGGEPRLFQFKENIKTLSSEAIDALTFRNSLGLNTQKHVQPFEQLLETFTGSMELYNVDRAWWFLPQVDEMMRMYPEAVHQAVIKTPVVDEYLEFFQNCPVKYMYMPIAKNMDEVRKVLSYDNINVVGIEAIAKGADNEMFDAENIRWMREQGLFVWVNAIALSDFEKHDMSGGCDDDRAVNGDMDGAWGALMDRGYNVIQTDWPALLNAFRKKKLG